MSPFLTYDSDPNYQVGIEVVSDLLLGYSGPLTVRIFRTDNNTAPVFEKVYNVSVVCHRAEFSLVVPYSYSCMHSHHIYPIKYDFFQDALDANEGARLSTSDLAPCADLVDSICLLTTEMDGAPDNFLFIQYPRSPAALRDPNIRVILACTSI